MIAVAALNIFRIAVLQLQRTSIDYKYYYLFFIANSPYEKPMRYIII